MNLAIVKILQESKRQQATCMYTPEEMETFPPDRLTAIYNGIIEVGERGPWKPKFSRAKLIGRGSGKKRSKSSPRRAGHGRS